MLSNRGKILLLQVAPALVAAWGVIGFTVWGICS